jgi:hypothetical protein
MDDCEFSRVLLPRCLAPTHPSIHPSTQALRAGYANIPIHPSTLTPPTFHARMAAILKRGVGVRWMATGVSLTGDSGTI